MSEVDLSKGIITGCDQALEWLLPWWIERVRENNPDAHISFHDYGISEGMKAYLSMENKVDSIAEVDTNAKTKHKWFLKPRSMLSSPFKKTLWLDVDAEVCGNIMDIFDKTIPDKLSMVQDMPWSKQFNTIMYNSGVVCFEGKPTILKRWAKAVDTNPQRGDQETLHAIMDPLQQVVSIEPLDNKYNVVRLQLDPKNPHYVKVPDTRIKHWTGHKGKEIIRQHLNLVKTRNMGDGYEIQDS